TTSIRSGRPTPCGLAANSAAITRPLWSKNIGTVPATLSNCTPRARNNRREKSVSFDIFIPLYLRSSALICGSAPTALDTLACSSTTQSSAPPSDPTHLFLPESADPQSPPPTLPSSPVAAASAKISPPPHPPHPPPPHPWAAY